MTTTHLYLPAAGEASLSSTMNHLPDDRWGETLRSGDTCQSGEGSLQGAKSPNSGNRQALAMHPSPNAVGGNRNDLSPQAIVRLAEDPPRARHEALGVGHIWCGIGVHMHLEVGGAGHQFAGPTRMIEVDVCE